MSFWTLFAWLTTAVDQPMRTAVDGQIDRLFPPIQHGMAVLLTIWIAFIGYRIATGGGGDDALGTAIRRLIFAAVVASAVTAAVYHNDIEAVALDLPNAIGNVISGAPPTGNTFDGLMGRAAAAGARLWQQTGSVSLWNVDVNMLLLKLLILLFWLAAGVFTLIAYAIWMGSRIALYLTIGIGPLFVPLFLFVATRGFFDRFIGVVATCITLQVLVTVFAGLMIDAETSVLSQFANPPAAADNPYPQVALLLGMALVMVFFTVTLRSLAGLATGLAGGAYLSSAQAAGNWLHGRTIGLLGRGAGAVGSAVSPGNAIQQVRRASLTPPGRSMSAPPSRPTP